MCLHLACNCCVIDPQGDEMLGQADQRGGGCPIPGGVQVWMGL